MTRNNPTSKQEIKERPPKKISKRYLTNSGLAYLQRFTASSSHFKTVMTRKINRSCEYHTDLSKEECMIWLDDVTAEFQNTGYLNDLAYGKGLLNSLSRKGLSIKAIEQKLKLKSLPNDLINKLIDDYKLVFENMNISISPDQLGAIRFTKRRKIGPYRSEKKEENQNRELSSLGRAGFNYNIAKFALELTQDEADELIYENSLY